MIMTNRIVIPFGSCDRMVRLLCDVVIGGLVFYGFR
jgi:hypothetical protein